MNNITMRYEGQYEILRSLWGVNNITMSYEGHYEYEGH